MRHAFIRNCDNAFKLAKSSQEYPLAIGNHKYTRWSELREFLLLRRKKVSKLELQTAKQYFEYVTSFIRIETYRVRIIKSVETNLESDPLILNGKISVVKEMALQSFIINLQFI